MSKLHAHNHGGGHSHGHDHGGGHRHNGGHSHAHAHGAMTTKAAIASVSTALFLLIIKSYAAAQSGSVAMLGSLADTGLDLAASLVTLFAVRYAMQPADNEHRFGHGKAEALSALFQVALITASALAIGWRAIIRFKNGAETVQPEYTIGVSFIAIAVTMALLLYQRWVIRRTGSVAIHADHVHYQSDLLLNAAVIAAIILDGIIGMKGADALFGLAISAWLLWGAWRASNIAIDQLMDREWPSEKREKFIQLAMAHSEIKGIHDMRTRSSGAHEFCQLHIWLDPHMSLSDAQQVVDKIKASLVHEFPAAEILIHPAPAEHPH